MNKKNNQFAYNWIYYLLVIIISIASWTFAFNIYHLPKDYESIKMFYSGSVKDYSFKEKVLEHFDNIVSFEIQSANPEDNVFNSKYSVVGFNGCDVLLLTYEVINQTACEEVFVELNDNYGNDYFVQQNKNYGIILSNDNKNNLSSYFDFKETDYVIAIAASSKNAGDITNNAYDYVKWIISYEN